MKIVFVVLLILSLLTACNFSGRDRTAVAGTYIRVFENDLYTLYDTIVFQPVGKVGGNIYQINQRSRTTFKKKEEQQFNKNARHSNTGTFDPETNIMHTGDPGILYSFDPDQGLVQINDIRYQKLK